MRLTVVVLLSLSMAACAAGNKTTQGPVPDNTAPTAAAKENPYAKEFVRRDLSQAAIQHEPDGPKVYRGNEESEDHQLMLENGYDMLGYSSFASGDVAPELLMQHARNIQADLVLVYTKLSGNTPASVKIQQLKSQAAQTSKDETGKDEARKDKPGAAPDGKLLPPEQIRYDYFASYWVKLAPPVIGVHVTQAKEEDKQQGLKVIAVIKDSPAAQAGIQDGDVLTRIGDVELSKPEALTAAAKRYAGQSVDAAWQHEGKPSGGNLSLNKAPR